MFTLKFNQHELDIAVAGIDSVMKQSPLLAFYVVESVGHNAVAIARSYLGTAGPNTANVPGVPWKPIGDWALRKRKMRQWPLPLLDTGSLRTGIKIISKRHGSNPSVTVSSTNWKSLFHENDAGYTRTRYGIIPNRPFMWPAVLETQTDTRYNKMIEDYVNKNLDRLANGKSITKPTSLILKAKARHSMATKTGLMKRYGFKASQLVTKPYKITSDDRRKK